MSEPATTKSIVLKLDTVGKNKTITIPQECEIYKGVLVLKSYVVQFPNANVSQNDIQVNIRGIDLEQNTNNRRDYLCLPVNRGTSTSGAKTTINDIDLVLTVQGHKLPRTLQYDLLDENFETTWADSSNAPARVYLYFQFQQSNI